MARLLPQRSGAKGATLGLWLKRILSSQGIARDLSVKAADCLILVGVRIYAVEGLHDHVVILQVAVALQEVRQHLLDLEDRSLDVAKLRVYYAVDVLLTDLEIDFRGNLRKHVLVEPLPIRLHVLELDCALIVAEIDQVLL